MEEKAKRLMTEWVCDIYLIKDKLSEPLKIRSSFNFAFIKDYTKLIDKINEVF